MEILFGLGLVIPKTRKYAAQLLVLLVLCMSLANLNMWINDIPFNGTRLSTTGHIVRWINSNPVADRTTVVGREDHVATQR